MTHEATVVLDVPRADGPPAALGQAPPVSRPQSAGLGDVRPVREHLRGEVYGMPLTPREFEVLAALAETDSRTAAAKRLGITDQTVGNITNHVFAKLGVKTRQAAFRHPAVGWLRIPGRADVTRQAVSAWLTSELGRIRAEATALISELRTGDTWARMLSWHLVRAGSVRTLCGRVPSTAAERSDELPLTAKSCEVCLRLAAHASAEAPA